MDELVPKDHGEEIAIFRSQVIGPVVHRQLTRGELRDALKGLARQKFRPPGAERTRHFSVPTLERWYYRFRKHGLAALRPQPRKDAGRAKALDEREKQLVCDVRREHPSASAELILATLVRQGRVREGAVSAATVRRLLAERGLDRVSLRGTHEGLERRRWEAAYPGALWHGDVCHGPVLTGGTKWEPLRIHALLDDRSRYVVALEARSTEREDDMLGLLVRAVRQHGVPEDTALLSRLHTRVRIAPVSLDDAAEYLRHRLRLAGCDRELFPRDVVALLHEASEGAHRELDRLAQLCLRDAACLKRKLVDGELVRSELEPTTSPATESSPRSRWRGSRGTRRRGLACVR
ncbi:helix-turn-helix domain-containing protein [Myxococcus sp. RHSTA-1-4]|uniref:helix-turn-helix domain-containing protein n=1 Tax=Myxococcus sp. RHSTA-1-4 TaxID=2874601 RepID=UPI001CBF5287|nr:helix-turn-helix domain-containing protein [Myxococcus sp. RHSTA-1-4]